MKIAVYCGSKFGNNDVYKDKAIALGKWIASNNNTLVYGGSKLGLMGIIANEVIKNGGEVIGVMPTFFIDSDLQDTTITKLIEVENMSERKKMMFEISDVFIAMPGGAGTLEEITEVISWANIGINNNPCIFYNVNNFYDYQKQQYNVMFEQGFLSEQGYQKILFSDNLVIIDEFIKNYTPPVNFKF